MEMLVWFRIALAIGLAGLILGIGIEAYRESFKDLISNTLLGFACLLWIAYVFTSLV